MYEDSRLERARDDVADLDHGCGRALRGEHLLGKPPPPAVASAAAAWYRGWWSDVRRRASSDAVDAPAGHDGHALLVEGSQLAGGTTLSTA